MSRRLLRCRACDRQVSLTAGTVLQDTRKPLRMWFLAMWFVTSQKNGVSALGLQRAYRGLEAEGYAHEPINLAGSWGDAALRLPAIHLVFGLAKRWLLGTHHGAVSAKHLQSYLDEYVFRLYGAMSVKG